MNLFTAKITLFIFFITLSGCTYMDIKHPFNRDPLTGGVNSNASALLHLPIPSGFQIYPSHSYTIKDNTGENCGLETFRGNVDENSAILAMFNTLNSFGWQLRLNLRQGNRSLCLYQKGERYVICAFYKQGMLTIMQIWAGNALPDGSLMDSTPIQSGESDDARAAEEYGPIEESQPAPGTIEKWGAPVEEREL